MFNKETRDLFKIEWKSLPEIKQEFEQELKRRIRNAKKK